MLIVNDLGTEVLNSEAVFSYQVAQTPEGQWVVLLHGTGLKTFVVVGSKDRCEKALATIVKGAKERWHVVDLLGILGQRPDLTVAQPGIIMPGNGEGRP